MTVFGAEALLPGFADPVADSQVCFRALLDAMARPGTIRRLATPAAAPDGWSPAMTALALALLDQDTAVWLDEAAASAAALAHLRFHCGARRVEQPQAAAFALIADAGTAPPLSAFSIGDPLYPERSATIVLAVESLEGGARLSLAGPGIRGKAEIAPVGLPGGFVPQWAGNHALYPSGVDVVLCAGDQVLCLPRGVSVTEG